MSHAAPHDHDGTHAKLRVSSWRCPPQLRQPGGRAGESSAGLSAVDQIFTLEQARLLMPDLLARADEAVKVRADLVELQSALNQGTTSPLGGLPEAKSLEARLSEILGWFSAEGLDLKGIAPLLLDFPAELDGDTVLLCWLEGERELRWYHKPEHGFAGRRPIPGTVG